MYACPVNDISIDFEIQWKFVMLLFILYPAGGRLNKKDGLTRYGDSHVKDKTS